MHRVQVSIKLLNKPLWLKTLKEALTSQSPWLIIARIKKLFGNTIVIILNIGNKYSWKYLKEISGKNIFIKNDPLLHRVYVSTRLLSKPLWFKNSEGSTGYSITIIDHCADIENFLETLLPLFETIGSKYSWQILKISERNFGPKKKIIEKKFALGQGLS